MKKLPNAIKIVGILVFAGLFIALSKDHKVYIDDQYAPNHTIGLRIVASISGLAIGLAIFGNPFKNS